MTTAYQYKIRLEKQNEVRTDLLFPVEEDKIDKSISKSVVRSVSYQTAEKVILEYEWLRSMPASAMFQFGIYFGGYCGGVEVFGGYPDENMWKTYKWKPVAIHIHRGACVHWTPVGTASHLISECLKWFRNNTPYRVFTATVDEEAGEIGTIYQACGFDYIGKYGESGHGRFFVDGKEIHPRTLYSMHGTSARDKIKAIYGNRVVVHEKQNFKKWYFKFIGSRKEIKENRKTIEKLIKPYPKRDEVKK